ncbi:GyrI-like domain-containing protein [uncultured Enorma sp.]|uniref:GyrI-like domain-containing protein n=1 Tax=uncultured Enorma sp. TaxID=1714346 RepID=UPI00265E3E92|nr:GyrI-like domain-containing protein [uncultured Enorma sp.]
MEHRIVEKPAFRLAGVIARVPMQFEGENPAIVELAQSITPAQRIELHRLQDMEPKRVVNASWNSDTDFQEEAGALTHLIGVPTTATEVGEGLELVEIPALTWAVFPSDGPHPQTMQQTTARIYAEWLSEAPWELDGFRMFSFSDIRDDGTAYSEIWVPVRKKGSGAA